MEMPLRMVQDEVHGAIKESSRGDFNGISMEHEKISGNDGIGVQRRLESVNFQARKVKREE